MHRLRGDILYQCALVDQSAVCTGWRETGFPVVDRGLGRGGREGEAAVGEGPAYRQFRGKPSSVFCLPLFRLFFLETILQLITQNMSSLTKEWMESLKWASKLMVIGVNPYIQVFGGKCVQRGKYLGE